MKNGILLEIADRWLADADEDRAEPDGSDVSAVAARAYARGKREAKRECADVLRMLDRLFP